MKSKIDSEEDTCDNPCICTVLLGKGHHMTRVLQPQRDIDREKGREREGERERERGREREQGLLLLVLRHYIARQYIKDVF